MKKILGMVLAVCMLCGTAALVGCKKDKGDNSSKSQATGNNNVEVPGDWDNPEGGNDWDDDWGL